MQRALEEGKDGVDDDHTENRPAERGHPFAGLHEFCRESQGDGDPEQNGQEVSELVEELGSSRTLGPY